MRGIARAIVVAPIRAYQRAVAPLLGPRCRYAPSCSDYAIDAISEYGIARGCVLAGWRLVRCNPFSQGGLDPVGAQRLFRGSRTGMRGSR